MRRGLVSTRNIEVQRPGVKLSVLDAARGTEQDSPASTFGIFKHSEKKDFIQ